MRAARTSTLIRVYVIETCRNWLRGTPASDSCTRHNAPAMQVLLLAYAVLELGMVGGTVFTENVMHAPASSLAANFLIASSALAGVVLIRCGRFQAGVVLFLTGLLCATEIALLTQSQGSQIANAQTPMILALVVSGVMLGRRALWRVFGTLVLMFASCYLAEQHDAHPVHSLHDAPGTAVLFLLIALVLDRYVRALQQKLVDAISHQDELRHEMDARERAQAKLVHARKVQATGQLANGIAHDFNNLLDLILGYATQRERILGIQDHAIQQAAIVRVLEGIEGAAMRGAVITRKLLDFNRFEHARPQCFDATAALVELRPLLCHLLPRTIDLALPTELGAAHVHFDRGEFDLMVLNIASNARDAMPHGGRFSVQIEREERHVRIAFTDTGHGMAAEVQERVFDPFFSTKVDGAGTGLGLTIIRDLVLASDGDIAVESELGNGSTIHVRLPAAGTPGSELAAGLPVASQSVP